MILWLDAHLPPRLAPWVAARFSTECVSIIDLNLFTADDLAIYQDACKARAVVMTKDAGFARLVHSLGPPPQIPWLTCGNTSNARLRQILELVLPSAFDLLEHGEPLVEIRDAVSP